MLCWKAGHITRTMDFFFYKSSNYVVAKFCIKIQIVSSIIYI